MAQRPPIDRAAVSWTEGLWPIRARAEPKVPSDVTENTTFLAGSKDFHLPDNPTLAANMKDEVELEMSLLRTTLISGTVLNEDGKPAAGIVVQAEGRGATNHYYRDVARTNAERFARTCEREVTPDAQAAILQLLK